MQAKCDSLIATPLAGCDRGTRYVPAIRPDPPERSNRGAVVGRLQRFVMRLASAREPSRARCLSRSRTTPSPAQRPTPEPAPGRDPPPPPPPPPATPPPASPPGGGAGGPSVRRGGPGGGPPPLPRGWLWRRAL